MPTTSSLSAPFVEGLQTQVLRYQHCPQCGQSQTLARYACAHCGSDALQWKQATGTATVRALTVVSRAPSDDFRELAPYTLVIAELDEGPRLMGHAHPAVHIGARVKADFFQHKERSLIRFIPL